MTAKMETMKQKHDELSAAYDALLAEHGQQSNTISELAVTNSTLQQEMARMQRENAEQIRRIEQEFQLERDAWKSSKTGMKQSLARLDGMVREHQSLKGQIVQLETRVQELTALRVRDGEILRATQEHLISAIKAKEDLKSELQAIAQASVK